jgi:hypothetical protein
VFQRYLAIGPGCVVTMLESADSAMFDYLSSCNVWGRDERIFWLYQKRQSVRHKIVLTNSSLGLKLSYYTLYILTRRLIMSHVQES